MSGEAINRETRAEAAAWLARLHADDRSLADEEAFRAWLAADPANATAFEAMDHTWSLAGGLSRNRRERNGISRRTVMAGGAGLAATAIGVLSFTRQSAARTYQTDIGEQRHISLEDGSQLFLNAETKLTVRFTDMQRDVDMEYGRANFRVAADPGRPFIVQAAERRIVANQCNFDVRCEDGKVQVVLIGGEAAMQPVGSPNIPRPQDVLRAGDRIVVEGGSNRRDRPNLTPLLAWQTGSAVFENETLADAVQEMNRYSSEKLEVADPRVKALRVSGVYRVGDNTAFARSISRLLPVNVDRRIDRLMLTAADSDSR
jgi:transmembrane sensor